MLVSAVGVSLEKGSTELGTADSSGAAGPGSEDSGAMVTTGVGVLLLG